MSWPRSDGIAEEAAAELYLGTMSWTGCCFCFRAMLVKLRDTRPGGKFEIVTMDIGGVPTQSFRQLPATVSHAVRPLFAKHAARTWVKFEGEQYTFAEAGKIIDAVAAALCNSFDVGLGDKVTIMMGNFPEALFAFVAVHHVGAAAVTSYPTKKAPEVEYYVKHSDAKVMFVDPENDLLRREAGLLGLRTVICRGDAAGATTWQELLRLGEGPLPSLDAVAPEDDAWIAYTSGSTGTPKGVCHSQRSLCAGIMLRELYAKLRADPKMLMSDRVGVASAIVASIMRAIAAGSLVIMRPHWDAGATLDVIEHEQLTGFWGKTSYVMDILEHPNLDVKRVASLKAIAVGGAPIPPALLKQVRHKIPHAALINGYGLTELSGLISMNSGADYLKQPTSVGRICPLMDVKIKDPETGAILPDGQRGEVCVKSVLTMKCYYKDPERTREIIDAEGYLHTEDIGKMENGLLYIIDRYKDVFFHDVLTVDCAEVESAFYTHPAVRECVVFGLPHVRKGEVPATAIRVRSTVTPAELHAHVGKICTAYKVPDPCHIFLHTEELPRAASDKLDKKGLRERYMKQVGLIGEPTA